MHSGEPAMKSNSAIRSICKSYDTALQPFDQVESHLGGEPYASALVIRPGASENKVNHLKFKGSQ